MCDNDTHHLAHSLSWCFECLVRLRPTIFFSRSNPHHAILLANSLKLTYGLEIPHIAAPDYLLIQPESPVIKPSVPLEHSAILCISNLQYQLGRRRLIHRLLNCPSLISFTHFFDFIPESNFRSLLSSSRYIFVPSINGQISPQIFYALSHQVLPIVDCFSALQTSKYHRSLSTYLVSIRSVLINLSFSDSTGSSSNFLSLVSTLKEYSAIRNFVSSLFPGWASYITRIFYPY